MSDDEIRVHPAAAVFPMLSDEELAELAASIKANGLRQPIVVDDDGVLIDGRNRLAACKLAGVEPTFARLNGHDAVAFIIDQNVNRRHLNEGQRAIATVRALLFKLKRTEINQSAVSRRTGVNVARLSQALDVIEYTPEMADAVMANTDKFSVVYQQAKQIKDAREHRERTAAAERAQLEGVRGADPDLHLMVIEGRLTLGDAVAVLEKRELERREQQKRHVRYMVDATTMLRTALYQPPETILDEWLDGLYPAQKEGPFAEQIWTPEGLRGLADDLRGLADVMAARREE